MNFYFKSKDSIFYILSTLKKSPSYKRVSVFIEPEHPFFDHLRRGKQLGDIIEKYSLQIVFLVSTQKQEEYYKNCYLTFESYKEKSFWNRIKILNVFRLTKDIHERLLLNSKLYILLLVTEMFLFGVLIWMLWKSIAPNTDIVITPDHTIETIATNIQVYTGDIQGNKNFITLHKDTIDFEYKMSLISDSVKVFTQPAQGEVVIINYLPYEISLSKNTKLIADDGSLYKISKEVKLFASDGISPTTTKVRVVAFDSREDGSLIGEEGNKEIDTKLLIRNMTESTIEMKIFAKVIKKLQGGRTLSSGSVLEKDISEIEEKSIKNVMQEKIHLLQGRLKNSGNKMIQPILFTDFINIKNTSFTTNVIPGNTTPFIESKMKGEIEYYYIYKKDIETLITDYLYERSSFYSKVTDINLDSITFESIKNITENKYVIPTKILITQKYDFGKDAYEIINEIRDKIKGMHKSEAETFLLKYDSIAKVSIKITPWWHQSISGNSERIRFFIK